VRLFCFKAMRMMTDRFKFCPICGSAAFEVNDFKSRRCADCGFTLYTNAAASVAVILEGPDGDVLVCRRAFEPAAGTLDLIGGFVDPGETLEEACVREVKEECGLDISKSSLRFIGSYHNEYLYSGIIVHTCDAVFVAEVSTSEAVASDDASECIWIPSSELRSRIPEFGFSSIREALMTYSR